MSKSQQALAIVLDGLMRRYKSRVPDVQRIVNEMVRVGMIDSVDDIINDHIAFRTLGIPNLGIASLEKVFLAYGYKRMDRYHFEKRSWTHIGMHLQLTL